MLIAMSVDMIDSSSVLVLINQIVFPALGHVNNEHRMESDLLVFNSCKGSVLWSS